MLLSHTFKCVFVHIPRTGGSWLTYKLRDMDPNLRGSGREVGLINAHPNRVEYVKTGRHGTLQQIYDLADVNLDEYYKFAISRHPYSRFQSAYEYYKKTETAQRAGFKNLWQMMDWIEQYGACKNHVMLQSRWYDHRLNKIFRFEEIEKINFANYVPNMPKYSKRNQIAKTVYTAELDEPLKKRIYKFYQEDFELFKYHP